MATSDTTPSPGARARRSSSRKKTPSADAPLVDTDEIETIIKHFTSMAEQSLEKMALGPLVPIAPAVIGLVGRYARREPLRAAVVAAGFAGVYFLGQVLAKDTVLTALRGAGRE
jgi:hypothetical protein